MMILIACVHLSSSRASVCACERTIPCGDVDSTRNDGLCLSFSSPHPAPGSCAGQVKPRRRSKTMMLVAISFQLALDRLHALLQQHVRVSGPPPMHALAVIDEDDALYLSRSRSGESTKDDEPRLRETVAVSRAGSALSAAAETCSK